MVNLQFPQVTWFREEFFIPQGKGLGVCTVFTRAWGLFPKFCGAQLNQP